MACSKANKKIIHKYLDEEITLLEKKQFQQHVTKCKECQAAFQELRKTVAIIQSASHFEAPSSLTENVMNKLPKESKLIRWKNWMRKHPLLLTVVTFFLVFVVSLSSDFSNANKEIVVQGDGQFIVDEERGVVVIPKGESISGNLLVRNGDLEISGHVLGDITVINGEHLLASADQVSGEIQEINQLMEWLWYQSKSFIKDIVGLNREKDDKKGTTVD